MFTNLQKKTETAPGLDPSSSAVTSESDSFRQQESVFITMNLCAMTVLVMAHVLFAPSMGSPARVVYVLFGLRIATQVAELIWIRGKGRVFSRELLRRYALGSVWINIVFAFTVSVAAQSEDAHYSVLMLLPLTAAAFRFSLPLVAATLAAASGLTFLEIWTYYRLDPPVEISEYFEAISMMALFVIVSIMVWLFAQHLRREELSLKRAYQELQRTRDKLIAEEKLAAVGRLSSAIAHEIRNPVAMVSSSLKMAQKQSTGEELRMELCEIATKEAARLERITNDFLSYARTREPDRKDVSIHGLLSYVADVARGKSDESGVAISVECDESLGASADELLLQQALLNLVLNAVEATASGDVVLLTATRDRDGLLRIAVQNPGQPIPTEDSDTVFEPFYTTKPGGTGLGLAIARNIAHVHGGKLILKRDGHADTVRFELQLPVISVSVPVELGV